MTKREAAIISAYTGFAIGEFRDTHAYIEEIMGRPVCTHELINEELIDEIKERSLIDLRNVVII